MSGSRRIFLKQVAAAPFGVALAGVSADVAAQTQAPAGYASLGPDEAAFVEMLVNVMCPADSLTVALVGAVTALFAATIGLKQWDIKKVLAYSSVSQLGYMFIGVGVGAYAAGVFHLVTHAFFKALLFLGSGSVIFAMHRAFHHTGSHADAQDMRNMGGLRRFMPFISRTCWVRSDFSCASELYSVCSFAFSEPDGASFKVSRTSPSTWFFSAI